MNRSTTAFAKANHPAQRARMAFACAPVSDLGIGIAVDLTLH